MSYVTAFLTDRSFRFILTPFILSLFFGSIAAGEYLVLYMNDQEGHYYIVGGIAAFVLYSLLDIVLGMVFPVEK